MFDLGQPVVRTINIRDEAGDLADADSVTCTITKPDLTTDTPTPSHDSTGVYSITYSPATVGRYALSWVATGTNASAFSDSFDVRDFSVALCSLDDAKDALNFTTTTHDDELRGYVLAATDLIERHIGAVVPRTVTETTTARGGYLALATTPVLSVTSITAQRDGGVAYDAAGFAVNGPAGLVYATDRSLVDPDVYAVTYVAGRGGVVPIRWVQACKVLVQHLWATQRGTSSPGRGRGGAEVDTTGTTYTMPNRVLELLQMDFLPPSVA